jgi:hypothetical protein
MAAMSSINVRPYQAPLISFLLYKFHKAVKDCLINQPLNYKVFKISISNVSISNSYIALRLTDNIFNHKCKDGAEPLKCIGQTDKYLPGCFSQDEDVSLLFHLENFKSIL